MAEHTPWQRFYRVLFRVLGPAQTGLPPYPTAEERAEHEQRNQPRTPTVREPPPGYRFLVYTDPNGVPRRALVPVDPAVPAPPADAAP